MRGEPQSGGAHRAPVAGAQDGGSDGGGADGAQDTAFCLALAGGDRQALAALYDRHAGLLLALGLRLLGSRSQAEDVLHDVFLEAWHRARDFDPARGTVRAWLVTRMRSRCLDRRASASRQARLAGELAHEGDAPSRKAPGEAIDGQRLQGQIADLPAELAEVIELGYFEGLSSSQIGQRLGIPVGTVKSRMARALSTLRQGLVGPERSEGRPLPDGRSGERGGDS
jgi:RNA polymerase sigma-70 factor (ECF subfamily)